MFEASLLLFVTHFDRGKWPVWRQFQWREKSNFKLKQKDARAFNYTFVNDLTNAAEIKMHKVFVFYSRRFFFDDLISTQGGSEKNERKFRAFISVALKASSDNTKSFLPLTKSSPWSNSSNSIDLFLINFRSFFRWVHTKLPAFVCLCVYLCVCHFDFPREKVNEWGEREREKENMQQWQRKHL